MKQHLRSVMFLFAFCCTIGFAEKVSLDFDRLFPETQLQTILEGCMQLQYEFTVRDSEQQMHEQEASLFVDIVVGRLFHMHSCVENIVKQKIFMHPEDRSYLLKMLDGLLRSYQKLFEIGLPAKGVHVVTLLANIKQKLLQ